MLGRTLMYLDKQGRGWGFELGGSEDKSRDERQRRGAVRMHA